MPAPLAPETIANQIEMQNSLFAELSSMFGKEVPLYDRSLLVNRACNKTVCALLAKLHIGFAISDSQLEKTGGERHGAIRIGRADEFRWIARFFGCFAMEPHNFYDMTNVGSKSQPIIATAFRAPLHPEHRVFTSLLMTEYFDATTRSRIEGVLAKREVFSARAKELVEKSERNGGLNWSDANELIKEGTDRIFKWTGSASDHALYKDLCGSGFKIAADIACFERHHLNHLTPNTLWMDLYTAAMKLCFGELDPETFQTRARLSLERLTVAADRNFLRLSFKHLTPTDLDTFKTGSVSSKEIASFVDELAARLQTPELRLSELKHSGFKDTTEGPSFDTPVLLRQDAYKALTEPVVFHNADGSTVNGSHTARFGEIEQRFYACTPVGRKLYNDCLAAAEAAIKKDPTLAKRDFAAFEALYASHFSSFPKTLPELIDRKYVYGEYEPTPKGLAAKGSIQTTDINELVRLGYARFDGLRYEDFLPVSAAGIFASNLNQYGTKSTASVKPVYTQSMLEEIMGKPIIDADLAYQGIHARSLQDTYAALGLTDRLSVAERAEIKTAASYAPVNHGTMAVSIAN